MIGPRNRLRLSAVLALIAIGLVLPPARAEALTNSNVIVVGSSECDGYVRKGFLASRLEQAGFAPSVMCISAASPAFGIDVAGMNPTPASTVVLTLGLNVRPLPIFEEPAQSELFAPKTDADGFITPDGFRQAVRETIDGMRTLGVERIIWFTIADNGHRWHDRYSANNSILRQEAERLDFEVVDWDRMTHPSLFGADGVHYTDPGYELFANTITETVSGAPAPSASQVGPCNFLTTGVTAADGAAVLGITEAEFLAGNPHWNPHWRFGGIICEPTDEVPHPLSTGTPTDENATRLVAYSPRTGTFSDHFIGIPDGGGQTRIIGPADRQDLGILGADYLSAIASGGLLLYDADTGRFAMLHSDQGGSWSLTREMRGTTGWTHVIPGDYDGDGDPDLLFYRTRDGLMRFYSVDETGTLVPLTSAMYGTRGWSHIVSGDFDGDGSDDVYWYRASDGLMRFYRVAATGRFVPISDALFGTRSWTHITEGSYRGGASSDLVFYRKDGLARFYRVEPLRGFTAISTRLTVESGYRQVVSGDFDGNGSDEVFWYRSAGSVVTALEASAHQALTGTTAMQQEVLFAGAE